jgi:hypothetical protein
MDEVPLRRTLKEEVEVYNQYLSGEVYGYQIIDDEGEVIDSLWGIYGYKEAEDLAKEAFEYHKKTRLDTKPNLLIEVRGGVIQAIKSNNPDKIRELLEGVRVIDYDEEGSLPCLYPVDKHENDTNP